MVCVSTRAYQNAPKKNLPAPTFSRSLQTRSVPGPSTPSQLQQLALYAASCITATWRGCRRSRAIETWALSGLAIGVLRARCCGGLGSLLRVRRGAGSMTSCEPSNATFVANRARRVHNYYSRLAVGNLRIDDRQEPSQ